MQSSDLLSQNLQIVHPRSNILLNIDLSQYKASANENYLEVTYGFFPSVISLVKKDDIYEGGMEINLTLKDKKKDSVLLHFPRNVTIQIHDTTETSISKIYMTKFTVKLPVSDYEIIVHYNDIVNKSRQDSIFHELSFYKFVDSESLSDVDICSNIIESDKTDSPFYKNTYETLTNPTRVFGSSFAPVLFSYIELYNLQNGKQYILSSKLLDWKGTLLLEQKRKKASHSKNIVDVSTMKLMSYPSGKYFYQVELSDTNGVMYAQRKKAIFIHNPNAHVAESVSNTRTFAFSAIYSTMTDEDLDNEFETLRYILRNEDEKIYKKLTSTQAKRDFLAQFWTDIENGKRGFQALTRLAYMERVTIANQRFRQFGKEGWRTDRGRVYILYGEPSDIERYPMSDNVKPYEQWQYDHIEGGVRFIFVDRSGYGEYVLVHSTKRGEIQDENWQRYLQ